MEAVRQASNESTPLAPTPKHLPSSTNWSARWRTHMDNFHSPKNQKRRLGICAGIWGLLTGMERAIIFPTLWLYFFKVFSIQAAVTYYGITLAAFNLSILITSPIYGYLGYRGVPVKILLLISNQLEVVGNVIYFVAGTPWLVLIGRFVAGLGGGSEVSLYADIVRATNRAERTPLIVVLLLARQFGLIAGPAATLILDKVDVKVGRININVYNMPGLFMAATWAAHTILLILLYPTIEQPEEDIVAASTPTSDLSDADLRSEKNEEPKSETKEESKELTEEEPTKETKEESKKRIAALRVKEMPFKEAIRFYLRWEVSATIASTFATYFCLMALEAVLPPLAKAYFSWNEVETSWVYLACGIAVIIVYSVLRLLSNYFQDRTLLVVGLVILCIGYLYLMGVFIAINVAQKTLYIWLTLIGVGIHVIGQPFGVACAESLYTKCIPLTDLDRGQSYLRLTINVAILIGPYIGGTLQSQAYIVFLLMFISVGLSLVICVVSYTRMEKPDEDELEITEVVNEDESGS